MATQRRRVEERFEVSFPIAEMDVVIIKSTAVLLPKNSQIIEDNLGNNTPHNIR